MSEGLKAQYRILSDLMKIDVKVLRLQHGLVQIPNDLAKFEQAISGRKTDLTKAKEALDAAEKKVRSVESNLKEKEELLRKAESKMMEVKTNEEYQAATKENAAQKGEKGSLEEQAIGLMGEVEEKRAIFKAAESTFKEFESSLSGDKKKLEDERANLMRLLEEQLLKRGQVATQLEAKLSMLYDRLSVRFKGDAIAITQQEMCLSCHMKIRPQLYNEVVSYRMIHQCPSCSKILVPQGLLDTETPDQAAG